MSEYEVIMKILLGLATLLLSASVYASASSITITDNTTDNIGNVQIKGVKGGTKQVGIDFAWYNGTLANEGIPQLSATLEPPSSAGEENYTIWINGFGGVNNLVVGSKSGCEITLNNGTSKYSTLSDQC
jgi:hypothetical protein